ncbi:fluoride efflux transporter FluC [Cumulibacter manganitolerans]|uniref:fluoride efflux transporter FluC n=1 Tax=Cumulibacter manganitolerans TaxID=1884992 RepID=UPI001E5FB3BC|nr:CrcB family protein [Cumulibacter manganitolerans]
MKVEKSPEPGPRPVYLERRYLALVAAGGGIGTGLRETLSLAMPPVAGIPFTTCAINVAGAFILGLLLETLVASGEDAGVRRTIRLFAGTGLLGGFTTYSALATDTVLLIKNAPLIGVAYALGTILFGAAATAAGIAIGALIRREGNR